jgi:hypothetical protein
MEKKINTNTSTLLKKKITLDLGTYKIIKVNSYQGDAGEYVNLIDWRQYLSTSKDDYQYHFNIDSRRSFVNEMTLASFFGAMLK